jgi:hypothetical protein
MKQNRLPWLLAVAAVLLLLRWFAPLQPASKAVDIVLPSEAVVCQSIPICIPIPIAHHERWEVGAGCTSNASCQRSATRSASNAEP